MKPKKIPALFFSGVAALFLSIPCQAVTIVWTNTLGGAWENAANWSPNQVPAAGDDVVVTNAGIYTVTNSSTVTLDGLLLGGMSGTQTLTGGSLSFTNAGLVGSNGVWNWGGGDLAGSLTVAQGGTLSISNSVTFAENDTSAGTTNTGALTNYGTVIFAGNITSYANYRGQGGAAIIDNAGLWESVADNSISAAGAGSSDIGASLFLNTGTLEETGGTGTGSIGWNFLNNGGTVTTASGSFSMGNWTGSGLVYGDATFSGGTINGTVAAGAIMTFSATINGSLTVSSNAVANWNGGDLEGSLTVAQGGTLSISNSVTFAGNGTSASYTNTAALTNYGTVIFAGNITSSANYRNQGGAAIIDNAGLWESVADNSISAAGAGSSALGASLFLNTGTLEETGGTGTGSIGWNFLNNGGTVTTASGSFSMGNWTGSGLVYGDATFSGGTINGTVAAGAIMTFSATINGSLTVSSNAVANWNGGDLEGSLTVAQGGTLSISNSVTFAGNGTSASYTNTAALTNYGTVIFAGNITSYANYRGQGGAAIIDNAGLWESVADNSISAAGAGSSALGASLFLNTGTLEKTGGTGTSTINWGFVNTGLIQTDVGGFTLDWSAPSILQGNLTLTGSTITASLTVASNAVLNLSGGDLEGSLTVAQGGTLSISNDVSFAVNDESSIYTNTAALTNYGTVIFAGNITSYANYQSQGGAAIIDNAGVWESVADNSISLGGAGSAAAGASLFLNTGTLEKTGGTGTGVTTINWHFDNEGGTINTPVRSFSMGNWTGSGLVYGDATLSGGTISGTVGEGAIMTFFSATINGPMTVSSNAVANWNGGDLEGSLTVAQGGTLSLSNGVTFAINDTGAAVTNTAALTNYGTVIFGGNITSYANYQSQGGEAIIDNAGVWESVADNSISLGGAGSSAMDASLFRNTGTLEKTGGTGTSTINWGFISTGIIQTDVGAFTLNWSGPSILQGGNLTLTGSTITAPLTVASNAVLNLSGGDLEGSLTVAPGGTLSLSNGVTFAFNDTGAAVTNTAALTNYGTVIFAGSITSYANYQSQGGAAIIDNAGLWESVADNSISVGGGGSSAVGASLFLNTGTLEKTGGTGTGATTINWHFDNEGGTINTPVGSFSMGNWTASGLVYGDATFSGMISGTIASNAVMTSLGGDLEGSLTVAQGGTLSLSNSVTFAENDTSAGTTNTAALTNYGTVIFAGSITSYANYQSQGGAAIIDNAGLWESVADNSISVGGAGSSAMGASLFRNTGTLEKTGGAGTSTINWNVLNNGGILGAQTNTLSLEGNYDLTGGTLNIGINSAGNHGTINLSGSPAALTGTVSVNLNNGYVPAAGNTFAALTYASFAGAFTNFSSVSGAIWQTNYDATSFVLTYLGQITWVTPANIIYGAALGASQLDPSTTPLVAGTFAFNPAAGTVLSSGAGRLLTTRFTPSNPDGAPASFQALITVLQAPLGITASPQAKTYGGNFSFAGTEFVPSGLVNGDTVTSASLASTGAISNAPVSGSPYGITISNALGDTGLSNYIISYTNGELTVNPAPLGITADSFSKIYGSNVNFAGTAFVSTTLSNLETIGTVTLMSSGAISTAPVSGSPYHITPSAATGGTFLPGNYAILYTNGLLTVNRAGLTVTANPASRQYGAANPAFSATYSGFVNGETVSVVSGAPGFSAAATATSGVGVYNVTPLAGTLVAANYTFGPFVPGELTITTATVTVSSGLTANSKAYDRTTTATLASNNVVLLGIVNGDAVTLDTNGYSAHFAGAGVGNGIAVTVGGLTLTGNGATNYSLTQPAGLAANITAATVSISSGITANSKVYDRTTTATITSNTVVLTGVVSGDTVTLNTNGYAAHFAGAGVGNGIAVTVSGLTLTGASNADYTLTQPAGLAANITAATVSISSGITANNKVYDRTTTATITSNTVVLTGVVSGDTVTLNTNGYSAHFAGAGVGNGIAVTVSGLTLTGASNADYTLTQPAGLAGNITAATVSISSGITANNKVYDRTTTATITSNTVVLTGVVSGDIVTLDTNGYIANFAGAGVGNGITVTVSGLTLTGASNADYTLTQPAGLAANITAPSLEIVANAPNVVLSWTTNAVVFVLNGTPALTSPITWRPITSGIVVSGTNNTFTTNANGGDHYYQLMIAP